MINDKTYQAIFNELRKYLEDGWEKIVVYLEYGNASYSFEFYVKRDGAYVKCFDLPEVSDRALSKSFKKIDKIVSKERKKIKDEELWTNMTMTVSKDEKMRAAFDYTDLEGGTYKYKKAWKKKYLC